MISRTYRRLNLNLLGVGATRSLDRDGGWAAASSIQSSCREDLKLNLPIDLTNQNILLAGAGGGWDIFGGLPLLYEWGGRTQSSSPTSRPESKASMCGSQLLLTIPKGNWPPFSICLSTSLEKRASAPLKAGYEKVVKEHDIDTIVSGRWRRGFADAGDEEGCGTIFQDTISVGMVDSLDVPTKILACVGFGTETEEGVCHYRALGTSRRSTKDGGFLGACALTAKMEAFQYYEEICGKVAAQTKSQSHVHQPHRPRRPRGIRTSTAMCSIFCSICRRRSPLRPHLLVLRRGGRGEARSLISAFANTTTFAEVDAIHKEMYPALKAKAQRTGSSAVRQP